MFQRVVIKRERCDVAAGVTSGEMLFGEIDPSVVNPMRIASKYFIMQLEAQSRRAQAIGPNFRVFAVGSLWTFRLLVLYKLGDTVLGPLEQAVVVSSDLERLFPFVVTGYIRLGAEQ